jgi:hypothetical protein
MLSSLIFGRSREQKFVAPLAAHARSFSGGDTCAAACSMLAKPRGRVAALVCCCHVAIHAGRARAPRWAQWHAHTRPILGAHRRARDPAGVVPAPRDAFAKLFWKHDLEGADPADSTAGSGVWTVDASGSRKSTAGDSAPLAPGRCTCV